MVLAHLISQIIVIGIKEDYTPFAPSANYSKHSRLNHFSMNRINLLFIALLFIVFISATWNNDIRHKHTYNPLMLYLMKPKPSMNCGKYALTNQGGKLVFAPFFYCRKNPMLQICVCYVNARWIVRGHCQWVLYHTREDLAKDLGF